MPDITMCRNEDCPLKERCYRFKAKPSPYGQSYTNFKFETSPESPVEATCHWFWRLENEYIK